MIRFILNEKEISTSLPPGSLLLDFIRYEKHLTGTKIGCREGDCGACTILVGEIKDGELRYSSATSCLMSIGNARGKHIVTIEGINLKGLNAIQQAMAEEGATQCGFCTPGFVVSLAGYCLNDLPSEKDNVIKAIDGNICRCTGYKSIERAAYKVAAIQEGRNGMKAIDFAVENEILPSYFKTIQKALEKIQPESNGSFNQDGIRKVLGGGTDLYVQQHEAMVDADIHFLFDEQELNGIKQNGRECILGASATVSDMANSPIFQKHFPSLGKIIKLISSTPIRNMATVAGNFTNASPIGDLTIMFLALNARLQLTDGISKRTVALRDFYKGYKILDKTNDEIIREISFQLPGKNDLFNFEKVCKRTHLDIASVNSAAYFNLEGDRKTSIAISAGGVGPVPMYLAATSSFLTENFKAAASYEELQEEAINLALSEISPISDARGSKEYKSLLLGQLIKAHLMEWKNGDCS